MAASCYCRSSSPHKARSAARAQWCFCGWRCTSHTFSSRCIHRQIAAGNPLQPVGHRLHPLGKFGKLCRFKSPPPPPTALSSSRAMARSPSASSVMLSQSFSVHPSIFQLRIAMSSVMRRRCCRRLSSNVGRQLPHRVAARYHLVPVLKFHQRRIHAARRQHSAQLSVPLR